LQAHFRSRQAIKEFHRQRENAKHRENIVREIIATERDYISNMDILINAFLKPIKDDPELGEGFKYTLLLFSDIQVSIGYNKQLLQFLEKRLNPWHPHQSLGDIFTLMSSFLKIYSSYCNNYDLGVREIAEQKKKFTKIQRISCDMYAKINSTRYSFLSHSTGSKNSTLQFASKKFKPTHRCRSQRQKGAH